MGGGEPEVTRKAVRKNVEKASRLQEGAGRGTLTLHQRSDGKAGTGEWGH